MNQNTIDLAIQALEAEKAKIAAAIAEMKSSLNGRTVAPRKATGGGAMSATIIVPAKAAAGRKRRITAAGRAALALAAKRRWAKAKAAGKSTL